MTTARHKDTDHTWTTLLMVVLVLLVALAPAPSQADPECTLTGTKADDVLRGTPAADRICAGSGDDVVRGLGGNDVLIGGGGADKIIGATGDDTLLGLGSGDQLIGGIGSDVLRGGTGDDLLQGGDGDDILHGNAGTDELNGGLGRDGCFPGALDELQLDCEDITAPLLLEFDLPETVDTSQAAQNVIVRARIFDDLSGLEPGDESSYRVSHVALRGPEGTSAEFSAEFLPGGAPGKEPNLVSGDEQNGVYESVVTLPRYSAQGTWKVGYVRLEDEAGNGRYLFPDRMELLGFPTTFEQVGPGDNAAPSVTEISVTPTSVDTSEGPQTITVDATISDDMSGVAWAMATFLSNGTRQRFNITLSPTAERNRYQGSAELPHYSEQGTWHLDQVSVEDHAGNFGGPYGDRLKETGLYRSFEQTGQGDVTGPRLAALDFTPKEINTSDGPQQITVTVRITDDLAGFSDGTLSFWGPGKVCNISCESGHQAVHARFTPETRVTGGTDLDGTYTATVTLPQYSELGTWKIHWVQLHDNARNETLLIEDNPDGQTFMGGRNGEVSALGFPVSFRNGCQQTPC